MARRRYVVWSGATSALTSTTDLAGISLTSNATPVANNSTFLQVKPTTNIAVIEWGYQLDAIPSVMTNVELITTGTVGATVTAFVAGDVCKYDDAGSAASAISLGTSASGFAGTADSTITASRLLDQGPGWSQFYCKQYPLDREPGISANDFLRIRAWGLTTAKIKCWIVFEE